MMEDTQKRNFEYFIYALALGLALALRLLRLGEVPLGDDEARWALQALDLSKGIRFAMGPQPAYVVLTGLVFFVLQISNFAARLVPALFGVSLTLIPFYFRDRLGKQTALVLAVLLAIDPGLLALSRQAGSPLLVITPFLCSLANWRNGNLRAAGFWVGVALLSGPQLWPGVLGLGITYGLYRGLNIQQFQASPSWLAAISPGSTFPNRKSWITLAASAAGTYVFFGSGLFLVSGGLGAGMASIPRYFSGWFETTTVPGIRLLQGLVFYELMAVLLAIAGVVRGIIRRNGLVISLGLWLLVSLVLTFAYPSRQVADLIWPLVPILSLTAIEISSYLVPIQNGKWETVGMAIFTCAILVFAALNYSAIALVSMDPAAVQLRWWILLGSLGMLVISIAMVAFGWSVSTALQGSIWGVLSVLFVYTISIAMASAGLRTSHTFELWSSGSYAGQVDTLLSQMKDVSQWKTGVNSSLDVTVAGLDSPALMWALRDWNVKVLADSNLSGSTPSVVIASDQFSSTEIQSTYRGQDLIWRVTPLWDQGLLTDWLRWSILHNFPLTNEKIILWVRSDVFIDSQNSQ